MFKRRQWIKIAENIILFSVLYLIFWCHFFCFLGVNMRWDANSLSARVLHLLHQFVPDLYSVTLLSDLKINKELYGHPDAVSDIHFFVNFDISNWLYLSQN